MPLNWCSRMESNHRPPPYQGGALPTELRERVACNGLCCLYWCHAAAGGAMERETGIEPAPSAWKAEVLPLNYSRAARNICGGGRWIRTTEGVSQQIYSLPPLAAWVSLPGKFVEAGETARNFRQNRAACQRRVNPPPSAPGGARPGVTR